MYHDIIVQALPFCACDISPPLPVPADVNANIKVLFSTLFQHYPRAVASMKDLLGFLIHSTDG